MHFHMAQKTKDPHARLRATVRGAIDRDGLVKTAKKIGVQPATLQRFMSATGTTHAGTVALVEKTFSQ